MNCLSRRLVCYRGPLISIFIGYVVALHKDGLGSNSMDEYSRHMG